MNAPSIQIPPSVSAVLPEGERDVALRSATNPQLGDFDRFARVQMEKTPDALIPPNLRSRAGRDAYGRGFGSDAVAGVTTASGPAARWASLMPLPRYDLTALSLGYYTAALPGEPSPLTGGLEEYLAVSPWLRGHYINRLIAIDSFLGRVSSLSVDSIRHSTLPWDQIHHHTLAVSTKSLHGRKIENFKDNLNTVLRDFNDDLYRYLTDNESSWHLHYDNVSQALWNSAEPVSLYRLHINMTTVNELDPTGLLGDVYIDVVLNFLKEKFGANKVVKTPEGTAFLVMASDAAVVNASLQEFSKTVKSRFESHPHVVNKSRLRDVVPSIMGAQSSISRQSILSYAIQTEEDLLVYRPLIEWVARRNNFPPTHIPTNLSDAKQLWANWQFPLNELRGSYPFLAQMAEAMTLEAVMQMNRELAAKAVFFERNRPVSPSLVFTDRDLPQQGALVASWQKLKDTGVGYVGPGQYRPKLEGHKGSTNNHAMMRLQGVRASILRYRKIYGQISHDSAARADEGRWSQRFLEAWNKLSDMTVDNAEFTTQLDQVQVFANHLRQAYQNVLGMAVSYPRYLGAMKGTDTVRVQRDGRDVWVKQNAPLVEIARQKNTLLAALEFDSLKAFLQKHPSLSMDDELVMKAWDVLFQTARQIGLADPILIPGKGDHLTFSFSDKTIAGHSVDPKQYLQQVQKNIHRLYEGMSFQDLKKVSYRIFNLEISSLEDLAEDAQKAKLEKLVLILEKKLNVSADVVITKTGATSIRIETPAEDAAGRPIGSTRILQELQTHFAHLVFNEASSIEMRRMPIWQSEQDPHQYFMSSRQREGWKAYEHSGLTVTMAFVKHSPVNSQATMREYLRAKARLDEALADAKFLNGYEKQVILDATIDSRASQVSQVRRTINVATRPPQSAMGEAVGTRPRPSGVHYHRRAARAFPLTRR